jgi:[acyl-carrier-protein] S-malonyltransferase
MLAPWLEDPAAAETVAAWSEATGLDLARLGTTADADEIKDTAVTQPLVVVNALLAAARLADAFPGALPDSAPTAGHSVGELAAAAIAGVLTPDEAVRLAAIRGRAMADACALEPTGMAAVLGGEESVVLARLEALGLDPANRNGAGQIVAAGPQSAIEALEKEPPEGARRAAVLPVAGAFHTRFMAPAEDAVRAAAAELSPGDPARPLLTNSDGSVVKGGAAALDLLVAQVTRPVRWDSCMATLGELGVTAVLELPPAGTLVGLVRRDLKGVKTLALKTPDDLDKAVALIEEHA